MKEETIFVYVLGLNKSSFYTGITNNMERRIKEHRTKRTGYTSNFKKKEIIFLFESDNRKEARKIEVYIKSIGAQKFLRRYERSLVCDKRTKLYNKQLISTH